MDAFDSSFLTFLFVPGAKCDVPRAKDRIDYFLGGIHGAGKQIVIPAPALSELLIAVGHSRKEILKQLTSNPKFKIASFDVLAALELALMAEAIRAATGHKKGDAGGTWAKVKFDRQIVAIAKANNVSTIYSEDRDIRNLAASQKITVKSVADLPLPPRPYEGKMLFEVAPEPKLLPEKAEEKKNRDE